VAAERGTEVPSPGAYAFAPIGVSCETETGQIQAY